MVAADPSSKALVFSQFTSMLDLCHFRLQQVCVCVCVCLCGCVGGFACVQVRVRVCEFMGGCGCVGVGVGVGVGEFMGRCENGSVGGGGEEVWV